MIPNQQRFWGKRGGGDQRFMQKWKYFRIYYWARRHQIPMVFSRICIYSCKKLKPTHRQNSVYNFCCWPVSTREDCIRWWWCVTLVLFHLNNHVLWGYERLFLLQKRFITGVSWGNLRLGNYAGVKVRNNMEQK